MPKYIVNGTNGAMEINPEWVPEGRRSGVLCSGNKGMNCSGTHQFQYKVKINGKPRTLLVRYRISQGRPQLLKTCTCTDTSEIYSVANWYSQMYLRAVEEMKGVAA